MCDLCQVAEHVHDSGTEIMEGPDRRRAKGRCIGEIRKRIGCLPQIKPEHIGDAVHPGSDGTECAPLPRRHVISARPCSTLSECACHCTTRRRNAHGIAEYELLYPWHPWAGCLVHIHEVVEKAGREVFRCSLSGRASGRWLEIPAWMFDRAARAAWRVGAAPYVDIAVLTALAALLQDVTSVSGAPSQLRD